MKTGQLTKEEVENQKTCADDITEADGGRTFTD